MPFLWKSGLLQSKILCQNSLDSQKPIQERSMAARTITNWFGDLVSHPAAIVEASSMTDIVDVLKNPAKYPSPVRAIGSFHSTAACGETDGGTMIRMAKMNRILSVGRDTVTVEAGAIYIDIAKQL